MKATAFCVTQVSLFEHSGGKTMQSKRFLDGEADSNLTQTIQNMLARREAYIGECQRRKVNFLPKQVVRPIWASKGLTDGQIGIVVTAGVTGSGMSTTLSQFLRMKHTAIGM